MNYYDQQQRSKKEKNRNEDKNQGLFDRILQPTSGWPLSLVQTKQDLTASNQPQGQKQLLRIDDEFCDEDKNTVIDYLKDDDEIAVELTSLDIWIQLFISFEILQINEQIDRPTKLSAQIQLKANRSWSNRYLMKVIQKLIIKMLNGYYNQKDDKKRAFLFNSLKFIFRQRYYQKSLSLKHFGIDETSNKENASGTSEYIEDDLAQLSDDTVSMTFDFDSTLNVMCNFKEIGGIFRQARQFDRIQHFQTLRNYPMTMTNKEKMQIQEQMRNFKMNSTMLHVLPEESKEQTQTVKSYNTSQYVQQEDFQTKNSKLRKLTDKFSSYFKKQTTQNDTSQDNNFNLLLNKSQELTINKQRKRDRFSSTVIKLPLDHKIFSYTPKAIQDIESIISTNEQVRNTLYGVLVVPLHKQNSSMINQMVSYNFDNKNKTQEEIKSVSDEDDDSSSQSSLDREQLLFQTNRRQSLMNIIQESSGSSSSGEDESNKSGNLDNYQDEEMKLNTTIVDKKQPETLDLQNPYILNSIYKI